MKAENKKRSLLALAAASAARALTPQGSKVWKKRRKRVQALAGLLVRGLILWQDHRGAIFKDQVLKKHV